MRLNIKAFALACGLIWGLGLFCMAWWLILLEGNNPEPCLLNRVYPGYTMTPVGLHHDPRGLTGRHGLGFGRRRHRRRHFRLAV
ncbi:MAG: hypothetical protein ACYTE0_14825 [Planctomycetota bacterium]|jgi:hypothetical protein